MGCNLREIVGEGAVIKDKLFEFIKSLLGQLKKIKCNNPKEESRQVVAKSFLIAAGQLNAQIIKALEQGCLSLAIVGLKTSLELDINANYIFDHPVHKNNFSRIDLICEDIFKRTNNLGAMKNKLDNKPLKKRAEEIGRLDLYEKKYAALADFSHLMLRQPTLNSPETFGKLSVSATTQALCNLWGVIDSIIQCFGLKWDEEIKKSVIEFRDKCEAIMVNPSL